MAVLVAPTFFCFGLRFLRRGRCPHRPAESEPAPTIGKNTKRRIPPPRRRVPLPTAAKEPKRRFWVGPLRLVVSTGGQNLSGPLPSFRATGPWRGGGFGLLLLPGPPGLYHAVWLGGECGPMRHRPLRKGCRMGVGADVPIRPSEPAPTAGGNRRAFSSSLPGFLPKSSQRQRRGSGGNRLYHPRRIRGMTSRQASLVTGVRGRATGVLALPGAQPPAIFGSFYCWKEHPILVNHSGFDCHTSPQMVN